MPRVKTEYRTAARSVYNEFCEKYPEVNISFDQWSEIIYKYNYGFRDYLLETGKRAKLPWGLGYFAISSKKTKKYKMVNGEQKINLAVDWKETKKLGRRVYHLNNHTDGRKFRWYWFPMESTIYQADIWIFKPSRVSSRKITEYVTDLQQSQIYKEWGRK